MKTFKDFLGENDEFLGEARQISKDATSAFLNREKFKRKNTEVYRNGDYHCFKLHGNEIARHHDNGKVEVSHAGWNTPTTRERTNTIAKALGHGKPFYQKSHQLHHDGVPIDSDEWVTLRHGHGD